MGLAALSMPTASASGLPACAGRLLPGSRPGRRLRRGLALDGYVSALRQAKLDAGRLEAEAAEAKARAERHGRDTEQTSQAIEAASPATNTPDLLLQRDTSLRRKGTRRTTTRRRSAGLARSSSATSRPGMAPPRVSER
jgi:hypothetical protein